MNESLTAAGRKWAERHQYDSMVANVALYGVTANTGWPPRFVTTAIQTANEQGQTREPVACAECGHLHFHGAAQGYSECPIDGCDCEGQ